MTTPIPPAAVGAPAPTSRSTFRLLAGSMDATNREADALRRALLDRWDDEVGQHRLELRLRSLDESDPGGDRGVEGRLAVWFSFADPGDGRLVDRDDPTLDGVSDELRDRLSASVRPAND